MAQKVNPIAVRLNFNRGSDSSWFSDYYYFRLFYQDVNLRYYLSSIRQRAIKKLGFGANKCLIHHYPKRSLIHLFCLGSLSKIKSPDLTSAKSKSSLQVTNVTCNLRSQYMNESFLNEGCLWQSDNSRLALNFSELKQSNFASSKKTESWHMKSSKRQKKKALVSLSRSFQENWPADGLFEEFLRQNYVDNLPKMNQNTFSPASKIIDELLDIGCFSNLKTNSLIKQPKGSFSYDRRDISLALRKNDVKFLANQKVESFRSQILFDSRWTNSVFNLLKQPHNRSIAAQSFFNYYAMQYFFFKKTNSIMDILFIHPVFQQASGSSERISPLLTKSRYFNISNIQSMLSSRSQTSTSIVPIKVNSIYQSAYLVAQEIAFKLEQKKSFRLICRSIFQEVDFCKYIKGIRISCSGRLNGAEIAKTECRKYGETSLHVFSDQIDYAQTKALTPYGILGIKVWISYFKKTQ
uniref:Small ribosomal subunit protein uS3m n=1 Tax=Gonatozygon brebissonii TaxID=184482 RepID=A0A6G9IG92_9VIRI|nr:ribosomal protein S3 [Gonatozygon brebissonii]QIQ23076.1 ribosomal protein S3 [Gonatozygon brebissonii]